MLRRVVLWTVAAVAVVALWLAVSSLVSGRFGQIYHREFASSRHERHFLASFAFFLAFAIVRLLTHAIRVGEGPFHNLVVGGRHIHHMVWGISLLLLVGYGWLLQVGTGVGGTSAWMSRATSLLFGVGAALTLDEFALWFNLKDVYWLPQGRESIDAVLLFGSLLSGGLWGASFLHALAREAVRLIVG